MGGILGAGGGRPPKERGRRSHHQRLSESVKTRLPASGRKGPVPPWPLTVHADPKGRAREAWWWKRMWKKPQATMWQLEQMDDAVARWCRLLVDWERTGRITALSELRALDDRLGLTPLSMLRLNWAIEDPVVEDVDAGPKVLSIRDRLAATD